MHGNDAIGVDYAGLCAGIGIVEGFACGPVKLGEHEALAVGIALYAVDGGVGRLNHQQRIAAVIMTHGEVVG